MLDAFYERRDVGRPFDPPTVIRIGVPDGEMWIEDTELGVEETRVLIGHVHMPSGPPVKGGFLRSGRLEVVVVVAEAHRFRFPGIDALLLAVRDQFEKRNRLAAIPIIGAPIEHRPGDYKPPPPPIRSFVPETLKRTG